jgi:hypothetical protein
VLLHLPLLLLLLPLEFCRTWVHVQHYPWRQYELLPILELLLLWSFAALSSGYRPQSRLWLLLLLLLTLV